MVCRARLLAFAHGLLRSRFKKQFSDNRSKSLFNKTTRKNVATTLAMDRACNPRTNGWENVSLTFLNFRARFARDRASKAKFWMFVQKVSVCVFPPPSPPFPKFSENV